MPENHDAQPEQVKISQSKPWLKHYSAEALAAPVPKRTAYQMLRHENQGKLNKTALNYYGTKITYSQLFDRIEQAARAFAASGVKEGDRVSFLSVAVPECIASVYALNKLGATANTIDPRMDIESIKRMIKGAESKVLVVIDLAWPKVPPMLADLDLDLIVVVSATTSLSPLKKFAMKLSMRTKVDYSEKVLAWEDFAARGTGVEAPEAPYVGDRVLSISYTGGTTNFPKGVMLTNDSANAVVHNFKHAGLARTPDDRFLGIIPIFTAYGMVCGTHMPLSLGCELIPIPKFEPAKFGKLVKQFRPEHMISTPSFYESLMKSKEVEHMDLSFMVTLGSGGDTMNDGLEHKLHEFMKQHNMKYPLAQGYGLSEMSAAVSFCVNETYKPKSVGIPSICTTAAIFDPETGEELGFNQIGEVCVTGPSMMKGYFNRPEETAAAIRMHDDGQMWLHAGDLGYMDEDGFLFIKGRIKRMITRFDGHKIFPVNIEGIVMEFPFVKNVSVVGVNDLDHSNGQYPLVVVELQKDLDPDETCRQLFDECQKRFEERGRPVAVVSVEAVPLTGNGKNDFRTLEAQFGDFDYKGWAAKA